MEVAAIRLVSAFPTFSVEQTRVRAALYAKKKPAETTKTKPSLPMTPTTTAIAGFRRRWERKYAMARNIAKPDTVREAHARSWP